VNWWGNLWGVYTLILVIVFVGIVLWAWSGKRARAFREAAELPLMEDRPQNKQPPAQSKEARHE
jgi:cbb3-type cytochrome oxidase subunit 3